MATHPSFFHLVCFRDGKDSESLRDGSICVPGHSTIVTRSTKTVSGWYCNEDFCSPRNMHGHWYQASIASINPKEDMVIIVLRVDWYDFISFFPAGLSFYDHVIEVVECLNTGWIATNYLVNIWRWYCRASHISTEFHPMWPIGNNLHDHNHNHHPWQQETTWYMY